RLYSSPGQDEDIETLFINIQAHCSSTPILYSYTMSLWPISSLLYVLLPCHRLNPSTKCDDVLVYLNEYKTADFKIEKHTPKYTGYTYQKVVDSSLESPLIVLMALFCSLKTCTGHTMIAPEEQAITHMGIIAFFCVVAISMALAQPQYYGYHPYGHVLPQPVADTPEVASAKAAHFAAYNAAAAAAAAAPDYDVVAAPVYHHAYAAPHYVGPIAGVPAIVNGVPADTPEVAAAKAAHFAAHAQVNAAHYEDLKIEEINRDLENVVRITQKDASNEAKWERTERKTQKQMVGRKVSLFGLFSPVSVYSILIYLFIGAPTFLLICEHCTELRRTNNFTDDINIVITIALLTTMLYFPLLSWFDLRSSVNHLNEWAQFQALHLVQSSYTRGHVMGTLYGFILLLLLFLHVSSLYTFLVGFRSDEISILEQINRFAPSVGSICTLYVVCNGGHRISVMQRQYKQNYVFLFRSFCNNSLMGVEIRNELLVISPIRTTHDVMEEVHERRFIERHFNTIKHKERINLLTKKDQPSESSSYSLSNKQSEFFRDITY
ncbi:hypothetical protein C0J52_26144, partial [Blattella germanica]